MVACLTLGANLLLILGFMMQFNVAFTLPGLAGLVLTIGMSVDANVLIFERIREERKRGRRVCEWPFETALGARRARSLTRT